MIQHLVSAIGGIAMLGVISVCLFFVVFGVAVLWAFCLKKPFLTSMSSLPLEDETGADTKGANHHG